MNLKLANERSSENKKLMSENENELNQKLVSASEETNARGLENFTLLGKIQLIDETTRLLRDELEKELELGM